MVDSLFVDKSQALGGYLQAYKAIFTFNPKPMGMKVGKESTACFVMGMGDVVSTYRALARNLTNFSHRDKPLVSNLWMIKNNRFL
jgi:hypothetical protein